MFIPEEPMIKLINKEHKLINQDKKIPTSISRALLTVSHII